MVIMERVLKAINIYCRYTIANLSLANILYKNLQFLEAAKYYINLYSTDSSSWYTLRQTAQCYEKLHVLPLITVPMYNMALAINPLDRVSMLRISNILIAQKQYKNAFSVTNEFLKNDSLNTRLLRLNGYAGLHSHKEDSAIISFNKCLDLNDTSFFVYKYLGLCYYGKHDYEPAIEHLEKAYVIDTSDIQTNFFLGSSYGRYVSKAKGIKFLKQTIKLLEPDKKFLSRTFAELGKTYESFYKPDEAYDAYQIAFEYDNTNTELYYLMGYYYYNTLEDINLAEKYLQMYIDSTLAKNSNTYTVKYNRKISEKIIEKINEERFWDGSKDQ